MKCIANQTLRNFRMFVCINQPDYWWNNPEKQKICHDNEASVRFLESLNGIDITIIDRYSPGCGWKGKHHGVGWARKTIMDAVGKVARPQDIILSMDADAVFNEGYFNSVTRNFSNHPDAVALAVPYFHNPVDDPNAYRAILHYEIYMRYYSINLWRIGSPYTFTALGSAIAVPVWAYRAIGGMTPKMSGEDFYFLQKLCKYGKMIFSNEEKIYPEARFSDRVYFGTGPAMIRGNSGDWSGYPIYPFMFFNEIKAFYNKLPGYQKNPSPTTPLEEEGLFNDPVHNFIQNQFNEPDPFLPLIKNYPDPEQFLRACHSKFDGLRILQYLKFRNNNASERDEMNLFSFLKEYYPSDLAELKIRGNEFSFERSSFEHLEKIRLFLMKKEEEYQVNSGLL